MAQPNSASSSLRDRLRSRLGMGATPAAPAAAVAEAAPPPAGGRAPMYGTADGVALNQGAAEGWRQNRGLGSAASAAPPAPAAPRGVGGRVAGGVARYGGRAAGPLAAIAEIPEVAREAEANPGVAGAATAIAKGATRVGGLQAGATAGGALGTALFGPYGGLAGTVIGGGAGYAGGDKAVEALSDANSGVRRSMTQYGTERPLPMPAMGGMLMTPGQLRAGQAAGIRPDAWSRRPVNIIENGESLPDDVLGPKPAPSAYVPENRGGPRTRARIEGSPGRQAERQRAFGARAAERMETPPLPTVQTEGAPQPSTMRSRTQGGVIKNPHAMSTMDQLYYSAQRFKGSPSMRRAAAELILGTEQREDANRQAELNANDATNAALTKSDADAREMFAQRRLKAQMSNAALAEDRRAGDLNRQVTREGNLLSSAGRAGAFRGKGGDDSTFAGQLYEDYIKAGYLPEQAAQRASRGATFAGQVEEDPVSNWGQAQDALGLDRGRREYADRWLGFGNDQFDPTTAQVADTAGFLEGALKPGVRRGDVRLRDAAGNTTWSAPSGIPAGETPASFQMRQQMQQRLRERREQETP